MSNDKERMSMNYKFKYNMHGTLDPTRSIQDQMNNANGYNKEKVEAYFKYLIEEEDFELVEDPFDLKPGYVLKFITDVRVHEPEEDDERELRLHPDRVEGRYFRSGGIIVDKKEDWFGLLIFNDVTTFQNSNFLKGVQKRINRGGSSFKVNPKYINGKHVVKGHDGQIIFAGRDKSAVERFKSTEKYKRYAEKHNLSE